MFSLSNGLSLLRAPLALLFLSENTLFRLAAILLAMLTDIVDGFVARRSRSVTQFGAILDPTMDKLFVFTALSIFIYEGRLELWQGLAMLSRDFALCIFGIYLTFTGRLRSYQFRAIRWGKISTALQFLILILLTLQLPVFSFIFAIFVLFGVLALAELFQFKKQPSPI